MPARRAIYYSSLQAIVPELVTDDGLEYANGILAGTEAGTEHLAGPVVGAWLFAMGKAIPFFADSLAMVMSAFPFGGFRSKAPNPRFLDIGLGGGPAPLCGPPPPHPALDGGLPGRPPGDGNRNPGLAGHDEWGVREGAYGIFLASGAAGSLLGSCGRTGWSAGSAAPRPHRCALVSGVAYLIMAVAPGWQLAGPAFSLVGFAVAPDPSSRTLSARG